MPQEQCDDGNTSPGDGCSSTCTIESSYACTDGNSVDTPDTCTFCNLTLGMYPEDRHVPEVCVARCGDSKLAGSEV